LPSSRHGLDLRNNRVAVVSPHDAAVLGHRQVQTIRGAGLAVDPRGRPNDQHGAEPNGLPRPWSRPMAALAGGDLFGLNAGAINARKPMVDGWRARCRQQRNFCPESRSVSVKKALRASRSSLATTKSSWSTWSGGWLPTASAASPTFPSPPQRTRR